MQTSLRAYTIICIAGLLAMFTSCGSESVAPGSLATGSAGHTPSASLVYDLGPDGRTTKPAQCVALAGSGYEALPLVTVGDEIPLVTGSYPHFGTSDSATYAL